MSDAWSRLMTGRLQATLEGCYKEVLKNHVRKSQQSRKLEQDRIKYVCKAPSQVFETTCCAAQPYIFILR